MGTNQSRGFSWKGTIAHKICWTVYLVAINLGKIGVCTPQSVLLPLTVPATRFGVDAVLSAYKTSGLKPGFRARSKLPSVPPRARVSATTAPCLRLPGRSFSSTIRHHTASGTPKHPRGFRGGKVARFCPQRAGRGAGPRLARGQRPGLGTRLCGTALMRPSCSPGQGMERAPPLNPRSPCS